MPDSSTPEPAFVLVYTALRSTQWARHPLVSGNRQWGYLQAGDTVMLSEPLSGSGPHWQPAQLVDGTRCFVRPDDFSPAALPDAT